MLSLVPLLLIVWFFSNQAVKAFPLTIEIYHYEPVKDEIVKQTINIDDEIIEKLIPQSDQKNDNYQTTAENSVEEVYEWDCAVPVKPDIIKNEGSQTRTVRNLLAVTDQESTQQSMVQTTIGGLNGVALNLINYGLSFINTIIPTSNH